MCYDIQQVAMHMQLRLQVHVSMRLVSSRPAYPTVPWFGWIVESLRCESLMRSLKARKQDLFSVLIAHLTGKEDGVPMVPNIEPSLLQSPSGR